ncbi:MAG TPA: thioredoxin [Pyrinomonadaceae bacterium]|nr:thioredoxin [Pyrinomonadaceae bacterium]
MSDSEFVNDVSDANFEAEVLQSDRPVLVDFWAAWCAPCRMIAPTVAQVAEKYSESARVVKLNVDDNPNVPQKYGIKGIPTLILFKNGKEEERVVGATTKEAISRMIDKHVNAGSGVANA